MDACRELVLLARQPARRREALSTKHQREHTTGAGATRTAARTTARSCATRGAARRAARGTAYGGADGGTDRDAD